LGRRGGFCGVGRGFDSAGDPAADSAGHG
jgi:hypothetical protein